MKHIPNCPACGCEVWIPEALYVAAIHSPKISFYCAYGHGMHYDEEAGKQNRMSYYGEQEAKTEKQTENVVKLVFSKEETSNGENKTE